MEGTYVGIHAGRRTDVGVLISLSQLSQRSKKHAVSWEWGWERSCQRFKGKEKGRICHPRDWETEQNGGIHIMYCIFYMTYIDIDIYKYI